MLVAITEVNMWEREKWTYILDVEKQGAQVLNWLNIFVKFAGKQFEIDSSAAKGNTEVFASSNYWVKFYDRYEKNERGNVVLVQGKERLIMNGKPNYKSAGLMLNKSISAARMKSAMIKMRDKGENNLYKNFESLFLK